MTELDPLDILVGTWSMEATFPGDPPVVQTGGELRVSWLLGRFLKMRAVINDPSAPDSLCLVSAAAGEGYVQHYFDDRGVVRLYAMTLVGDQWTLTRESPDFTPLDFRQRFVARIGDDVIDGEWQTDTADRGWQRDFGLTYRRIH